MVKIIVQNEKEKDLINKFLDMMINGVLDQVSEIDYKQSIEDGENPFLNSDEYLFLDNGFYWSDIIVNDTEKPMIIHPSNITGECVGCGSNTEGTLDGYDIDYEEYLKLNSKEVRENWLCENCMVKENVNDQAE